MTPEPAPEIAVGTAISGAGSAIVDRVRLLADDLRRAGVAVGLASVVEACAALSHVDLAARAEVRLALRCTLVTRAEDEAVFDVLFDAHFAVRRPPAPAPSTGDEDLARQIAAALAAGDDAELGALARRTAGQHAGPSGRSDRHHLQRAVRALRTHTLAHEALRLRRGGGPRRDEVTESLDRAEIAALLDRFLAALAAATRHDAVVHRPEDVEIAGASVVELRELRRAVRPLAQRLAARLHVRRQRPIGALDVRRTIRRSLGAGGVPLDPTFRRRHPHRADLWLLCDVSGSVAEFARFTIGMLTAIHDEVPRLRSFLFVDDIVEVTGLLAARTHDVDAFAVVTGAGAPLGGRRSDWGRVLARFRDAHGASLTVRSTVVLTGDARTHDHDPRPEVVTDLVRRCRGVWLLDPEPVAAWSTADAAVTPYRRAGARVLEVRTLRQLAEAVEAIVRGSA